VVAYATPPNFVTGAVVTESQLDTLSNDIVFLAGSPSGRIYHSANQSILTSGVAQSLLFNSERWDTDSDHSAVTNSDRVTLTTAGKYMFGVAGVWDISATGYRDVYFERFNSSGVSQNVYAYDRRPAMAGGVSMPFALAGVLIDCAASDYVVARVIQTSGGALSITTAAKFSPEMWWQWVSL
jgi:hypothetical protein